MTNQFVCICGGKQNSIDSSSSFSYFLNNSEGFDSENLFLRIVTLWKRLPSLCLPNYFNLNLFSSLRSTVIYPKYPHNNTRYFLVLRTYKNFIQKTSSLSDTWALYLMNNSITKQFDKQLKFSCLDYNIPLRNDD